MTGDIPAELGNLSNLQELYLYDNELTGDIPTELGNLSNLAWLYLSGNQLTGDIPTEMSSLSNLETPGHRGEPVGRGYTAGAGRPVQPDGADSACWRVHPAQPRRCARSTSDSNCYANRYIPADPNPCNACAYGILGQGCGCSPGRRSVLRCQR